jgi:hypothetical protein
MKTKLILGSVIILSLLTVISVAQRPDEPIKGDFKITIRQTVAGQSTQNTAMIKGLRERDETNMSAGGMSITQCDMRRTIKINDQARKYMVSPMDSDETSDSAPSGGGNPSTGEPSKRGGLVTLTINTVDTGERKEMFGLTARHLKRTMMSQASPDACSQQAFKMEVDGWYINLEYGLSCPSQRPPQTGRPGVTGGCRDRYQYKRTGPTNVGYPLIETTTMLGADGSATFSMTKEVIELSRQPLDAALFDVPAGYTEAHNQQEMSGVPSMADIMAMQRQQAGQTNQPSTSDATPSAPQSTTNVAEKPRVGVVEFTNKTKTSASTDSLRDQLIAALNGDGVDAVALNTSSPSEAEIEAKAKGCAFILYTDISTLKAPSSGKKIGGMLGSAAGIGSGGAGKAEVRFDFRLMKAGSSSPAVQSSASGKEDSQEASVSSALQSEASAVAAGVSKSN